MPVLTGRVLFNHQLRKGPRLRKPPPKLRKPLLTVPQILACADEFHADTGKWPQLTSGAVSRGSNETWSAVNQALYAGQRGLAGGSSLARLLSAHRGVRNKAALPHLKVQDILDWSDAHHQRTGQWPTKTSGPVAGAAPETWMAVNQALLRGLRGLSGGSSLARLLATHRGVRHRKDLPKLTKDQILRWADSHHRRTGKWPACRAGVIAEAPGETWFGVDCALRNGGRGQPGGSSLANLLSARRGARNHLQLPNLNLETILAWADGHHARNGTWPRQKSGAIPEVAGENWAAIDMALLVGRRGLPGGSSLARLLAAERGVRNPGGLCQLSVKQILAWADAHHARTGAWPGTQSGAITGAPGETWQLVDAALGKGQRGLPGGSSLPRLLAARRGRRNPTNLPRLSVARIRAWADAHHARTGAWPGQTSGPIREAPGETWCGVNKALAKGSRGLPGGVTLATFLAEHRGVRTPETGPNSRSRRS